MINQLRKIISDYFGFTRNETNGLMLIFIMMIVLLFLPFIYRCLKNSDYDMSVQDKKILDSLMMVFHNHDAMVEHAEVDPVGINELFFFNPNNATKEELMQLGLDPVLAGRIINYRKAGGVFHVKDDLLKIYGLSKNVFNDVYEYIDLPIKSIEIKSTDPVLTADNSIDPQNCNTDQPSLSIDLNSADTTELKKISGIGNVFSARIVKYRQLLGGYVNTGQLYEVYGLKKDAIKEILEVCYIPDNYHPQTISINFADWYTLVKHPYIDKDIANAIIESRSEQGPFTREEDLKRVTLISDSLYNKLIPYLDF